MIVEVMRFPLLKPDNIDELVTVDGLEYLEKAYKEGKGVIMATGHFRQLGAFRRYGGAARLPDAFHHAQAE